MSATTPESRRLPRASWLLGVLFLILFQSAPLRAEEPHWQPSDGERSEETRAGPSFDGMAYLFPLRLHLSRGGSLAGGLGGVDVSGGRLLLVLARESLLVDFGLVVGVTPLADLPGDEVLRGAPPPPLVDAVPVKYRWRPTWRSHLGVLLSFVLPGAGQFIQKKDRELGFLVMAGVASSVATGLLALYAPSSYGARSRATIGGLLFGLGGTVAVGGAIHAYQTGRERRPVP